MRLFNDAIRESQRFHHPQDMDRRRGQLAQDLEPEYSASFS